MKRVMLVAIAVWLIIMSVDGQIKTDSTRADTLTNMPDTSFRKFENPANPSIITPNTAPGMNVPSNTLPGINSPSSPGSTFPSGNPAASPGTQIAPDTSRLPGNRNVPVSPGISNPATTPGLPGPQDITPVPGNPALPSTPGIPNVQTPLPD